MTPLPVIVALLSTAPARALEGLDVTPGELVRVYDPDYPGALARTETVSLLAEPPDDPDVAWDWETLAVPDGTPGQATLDALNADLWHDAGWRGQGVRVAVFDVQWQGAQTVPEVLGPVTTADCWAHPSCETALETIEARFGYEVGVHGYACAQTIHELAPDAELFLVRVNGLSTLRSAVDWAIRHDIDLVSMSMSFFNDSFYDGTGPHQELARRLEAHDILLVSSAGNSARQHWSGAWTDGDGDGRMDFDGSNRLELRLTGSDARRGLYVIWDEFHGCGLSDLDAYVYDAQGQLVGRSELRQRFDQSPCSPVERPSVYVASDGSYYLELVARQLTAPGLQVDVQTTNGTIPDGVREDSMADPASVAEVFTVGAVRADGYLTNTVESFSSQGPGRGRSPKPDIAGPDGLTVEAYGSVGFFGTSASTPAVTGALALVLSRHPDWTPRQAAQQLQAWAIGDGTDRFDPRWGAGRARLPNPERTDVGCGSRGHLALGWLVVPLAWRRRRVSPRRPRDPAAG